MSVADSETLRAHGVRISSVPHDPYRITVHGRPAELAIIDAETGRVIASGRQVARECADIGMRMTEQAWAGRGWIHVISPVETTAAQAA